MTRVLCIVAVLLAVGARGRDVGAPGQGTPFAVTINAQPQRVDQYCEQTITLPASLHGGHVVGFERIKGLAHHIIVSACEYDAAQHQACAADQSQCHLPADACRSSPASCKNMRIIFVWAHGGEPLRLPAGVGVRVGPGHVGAVHLQVHYGSPVAGNMVDHAGVQLFAQPGNPKHDSAVFLMVPPLFTLKPGRAEEIVGGVKCAKSNMHVFAVRVHAHSLGMENSFAVLRPPAGRGGCQPAGKPSDPKGMERVFSYAYSPQNPQSFVSLDKPALVRKGDAVAFKCSYDTHAATHGIRAGSRAHDEMCNVYLMYYPLSDAEFAAAEQKAAGGESAAATAATDATAAAAATAATDAAAATAATAATDAAAAAAPGVGQEGGRVGDDDDDNKAGQHTGLSSSATDHAAQQLSLQVDTRWSLAASESVDRAFQMPGVAVGQASGLVWAFHRGMRTWELGSFNNRNVLVGQHRQRPIAENTVVALDANTGQRVVAWGRDTFYMPHSITEDPSGMSVWVTDVGLHQVLQLDARTGRVLDTLGQAFVPGEDLAHFCKPTHVAFSPSGEHLYVTDGYCNSRVVKVRVGKGGGRRRLPRQREGHATPVLQWSARMSVPHAVAVHRFQVADNACGAQPAADTVFVCDREHRKVIVFSDTGKVLHTMTTTDRWNPYAISLPSLPSASSFAADSPLVALGLADRRLRAGAVTVTPVCGAPKLEGQPETGDANKPTGAWAGLSTLKQPHMLSFSPDGSSVFVADCPDGQHYGRLFKFNLEWIEE